MTLPGGKRLQKETTVAFCFFLSTVSNSNRAIYSISKHSRHGMLGFEPVSPLRLEATMSKKFSTSIQSLPFVEEIALTLANKVNCPM